MNITMETEESTEALNEAWAAVLDGDFEGADRRRTRAEAEADATWLRRHPARLDRVTHGHGGGVRVVRVSQCEWTGEWGEETGEYLGDILRVDGMSDEVWGDG